MVDILSDGRLELGLGAGWRAAEFPAFGADYARRYQALEETVRALPGLWDSGRVTPGPLQWPLPVWVGARGPRGARLAGRTGAGLLWIDRDLMAPYLAGLAEADPPALPRVGGLVNVFLADDPDRVRAAVRENGRRNRASYEDAGRHGPGGRLPPAADPDPGRRRGWIAELCAGLPVTDVFCFGDIGGLDDDLVDRHTELAVRELPPCWPRKENSDEHRHRPGPALTELTEDPFAYFARLRDTDPVHWAEANKAWLLTRYDDVVAAYADPRLSSDRVRPLLGVLPPQRRAEYGPMLETIGHWMVVTDPPVHTRLRKLATTRSGSSGSTRWADGSASWWTTCSTTSSRPASDDFLNRIAYPLPAAVIARMMGAPQQDRDKFQHWSDELALVAFSAGGEDRASRYARALAGVRELQEYLAELIERRRREPGEDMISLLLSGREAKATTWTTAS